MSKMTPLLSVLGKCAHNFNRNLTKPSISRRFLTTNSLRFEKAENSSSSSAFPKKSMEATHRPTNVEKYYLVWMKKFPSVSEVPEKVSMDMIQTVRDWARIKINIIVCMLTILACVGLVWSGKRAAKRGESMHKMNIDWHKSQKEEAAKKG